MMSTTQKLADFAKEFKIDSTGLDKVLEKLESINTQDSKELFEVGKLIKENSKKFSPNTLKSISDINLRIANSISKGENYEPHVKTMKSLIRKSLKKKSRPFL